MSSIVKITKDLRSAIIIIVLCIQLLFIHGCSCFPKTAAVTLLNQRPFIYEHFFQVLDSEVKKYGKRNASCFQINGFPYLRTTRFLAAMADQADNNQKNLLMLRMKETALNSIESEINNLPENSIKYIASEFENIYDRDSLIKHLRIYSDALFAHDSQNINHFNIIKESINIPDEYSNFMRIIGLYPLVSLPVGFLTYRAYNKIRDWHQIPNKDISYQGTPFIYAPFEDQAISQEHIKSIFKQSKSDSLGLPVLSKTEIKSLVQSFAPILFQDITGNFDHIGRIEWKNGSIHVNSSIPAVYYYISYGFLKHKPVMQINYVLWYSKRAGDKAPWIEKGSLDGLTIRISLDACGSPFMADIMNSCGCYHFFIPEKERIAKIIPASFEPDPLVPVWLPKDFPGKRLKLSINSGWHQIENISSSHINANSIKYQLLPYELLESLPREDNTRESMFDSKGIAKNSSRIEPYFLFSMGIKKVGFMRQRGHHATKLIGREIFDDPEIFNNNFIFSSP